MTENKFNIPIDNSLVGRLKSTVRPMYYWLKVRYVYIKGILFSQKPNDIKQIPIIINNFNRLEMPMLLIEALKERGYKNIYILDNDSTYPPLLEYYKSCPYKVILLCRNVGYLALWKTDIYQQFIKGYYVYTDPDVVMVDQCPADFMQHLYDLLQRYPYSSKAGLSLKIDDLPDYFDKKKEVIEWEGQYWKYEIEKGVYEAPIDTTFALYRPFVKGGANFYEKQLRTDFPYQIHHLPWYNRPDELSDEEIYYRGNAKTSTHWTNAK